MNWHSSETYGIIALGAALLIWRGPIICLIVFLILIGSGALTLRLTNPAFKRALQILTILALLLLSGVIPVLIGAIAYAIPKIIAYLTARLSKQPVSSIIQK